MLRFVFQDWDFPHFMSNIDIKLPGVNTAHIKFSIPKFLKREKWDVHITGEKNYSRRLPESSFHFFQLFKVLKTEDLY